MREKYNKYNDVSEPVMVSSIRGDKLKRGRLSENRFLGNSLSFKSGEYRESRFRIKLYRFMAESIPLVSSVIWTWSRLAAAPGKFILSKDDKQIENNRARQTIEDLFRRIIKENFGHSGSINEILPAFFQSLFLDGNVAGQIKLHSDMSGVESFRFFDMSKSEVEISSRGDIKIVSADEKGERAYSGNDLFFYGHNSDLSNPYGKSILKAVSFVSYVEQQLVDDMRRATHNAGYHRLHIKIKPPEKKEEESDEAYVRRANSYFDDTVSMIRDIETEDNPVTWDDVAIEYIGPRMQGGARTSNWYLTHRAMIEEICSGTNLAPFLLGYSYNATTNWAQFKYDLVMRQVHSAQYAARNFMTWLANIELALKGFKLRADWEFDNNFSALAKEQTDTKSKQAAYIIDLFNAGLIDRDEAAKKAAGLL
ncbi:MAG: hypothetical protein ABIE07_01140 [Candidatus Zixiibacteriota bacterium]